MARDAVIAARLDLIAAKAKILSEQYKNNQLWDGDLSKQLGEIENEIRLITRGESGWATTSRSGTWYPDDK